MAWWLHGVVALPPKTVPCGSLPKLVSWWETALFFFRHWLAEHSTTTNLNALFFLVKRTVPDRFCWTRLDCRPAKAHSSLLTCVAEVLCASIGDAKAPTPSKCPAVYGSFGRNHGTTLNFPP